MSRVIQQHQVGDGDGVGIEADVHEQAVEGFDGLAVGAAHPHTGYGIFAQDLNDLGVVAHLNLGGRGDAFPQHALGVQFVAAVEQDDPIGVLG